MPDVNIQEILSLPIAALAIFFMYKLSSNHVQHLTDATAEQTAMLREFLGWLKGKFGEGETG